jgi:hypothetical protein
MLSSYPKTKEVVQLPYNVVQYEQNYFGFIIFLFHEMTETLQVVSKMILKLLVRNW